MVDDYGGYKQLFAAGITELACWAHARRKFFDAWKASASPWRAKPWSHRRDIPHRGEAAGPGRRRPHPRAAALVPDRGSTASKPGWMIIATQVMGNSGLSRAIAYTLKRWGALVRILDDGAWPLDNNPIERAIRPVAVGRKNWLFAGSETAGKRAAAIMSLIATAKANGIEPHAWLTDVLTRLPTTKDRDIDTCCHWHSVSQ